MGAFKSVTCSSGKDNTVRNASGRCTLLNAARYGTAVALTVITTRQTTLTCCPNPSLPHPLNHLSNHPTNHPINRLPTYLAPPSPFFTTPPTTHRHPSPLQQHYWWAAAMKEAFPGSLLVAPLGLALAHKTLPVDVRVTQLAGPQDLPGSWPLQVLDVMTVGRVV